MLASLAYLKQFERVVDSTVEQKTESAATAEPETSTATEVAESKTDTSVTTAMETGEKKTGSV